MVHVLVLLYSTLTQDIGALRSHIYQVNFAMIKMFAKIWLLAMVITSVVIFGITAQTGDPWQTTVAVLAFVGAFVWVVWFIVVAAMPWVLK